MREPKTVKTSSWREPLSTRQLAVAIGVSESSVRRWIDDGRLACSRTHGGHRRIPVDEAVKFVRSTRSPVVRPDLLGLPVGTGGRIDDDSFCQFVADGRSREVTSALFAAYLDGRSIADLCDGPVRAAMQHVGDLWPDDKRSVLVEHRATRIVLAALQQLRAVLPVPEENAPTAIGGAPQDDPYALPSLAVSLVLHESGCDEVDLGPNTPLDVIEDAFEEEQPDVVWLSISAPLRSRRVCREIDRLAETVVSAGSGLVVGGRAAHTYEEGPDAHVVRCSSLRALAEWFATRHETS